MEIEIMCVKYVKEPILKSVGSGNKKAWTTGIGTKNYEQVDIVQLNANKPN